jgi:hypothetical protein
MEVPMQTFRCQSCNNPIYFENSRCTHCGHVLGALPDVTQMSALEPADSGLWQPLAAGARGRLYRQCDNYRQHQVCNWMVPADSDRSLCDACRFNTTIPNLSGSRNLEHWRRIERSKRRLIYGLMRLRLPLIDKRQDPERGLAFAFPSAQDAVPGELVSTGHDTGLITINIDEADPAVRERARVDLDERYRTLLGHFRHEIGHYYWDLLIRGDIDAADGTPGPADAQQQRLEAFRAQFGDERADYSAALSTHYDEGPPGDWQDQYISAYAAAHPWEDWAETWAHYLHIVDTLETAAHFGLEVERPMPNGKVQRSDPQFDPYRIDAFEPLIQHWLPLTFALNSLNRSMGLADLYPFVISGPVIDKLRFVHETIRRQHGIATTGP